VSREIDSIFKLPLPAAKTENKPKRKLTSHRYCILIPVIFHSSYFAEYPYFLLADIATAKLGFIYDNKV
jgi:hypothetical protein